MNNYDLLHAWCSLWRTPGIGVKRFIRICEVFGSPEAFFLASQQQRKKHGFLIDEANILRAKKEAEKDLNWLGENRDALILTLEDSRYPLQLKRITDPPPILFVRGQVELLQFPQLAIVGSRSPSHEGKENAFSFAAFMSQNGVLVTSGMALGIDASSHLGALSTGETIAVMGTGPDRIYPAKNQALAHSILEKGVVVTEFSVGSPVRPESFPRRNRIISGLSLGVLVIEASIKSGSLITANLATEQGREVFAVPGSIHNPLAKGCNYLIKNGAKLVEDASDIFEEIKPQIQSFIKQEKTITINSKQKIPDKVDLKEDKIPNLKDPFIKKLWKSLDYTPNSIDTLIKRSQLKAEEVSSMLLILELEGFVRKESGLYYKAK